MKIIHCADLHIDSKSKFDEQKKQIKRHQLLQNFAEMVNYAQQNQVECILICGDFFDQTKPLKRSLKFVQDVILENQNIKFFYIFGNHDEKLRIFEKNPSNFYDFATTFSKVDFENLSIGGASYSRYISEDFYQKINFDKDRFNILMLHAPLEKDKYCDSLQYKLLENVDYLALGHIHKRSEGKLLNRGQWGYCGCLESKSFSDLGKCGFDLLEIEDKKLKKTFVPFSKYDFNVVEIDISNSSTYQTIINKIDAKVLSYGEKDALRLVLKGVRAEETESAVDLLKENYKNRFFYLEISDQTKVEFDLKKYSQEKLSLKAEFINNVFSDQNLSDEDKQQICIFGLQALKGEEVSL